LPPTIVDLPPTYYTPEPPFAPLPSTVAAPRSQALPPTIALPTGAVALGNQKEFQEPPTENVKPTEQQSEKKNTYSPARYMLLFAIGGTALCLILSANLHTANAPLIWNNFAVSGLFGATLGICLSELRRSHLWSLRNRSRVLTLLAHCAFCITAAMAPFVFEEPWQYNIRRTGDYSLNFNKTVIYQRMAESIFFVTLLGSLVGLAIWLIRLKVTQSRKDKVTNHSPLP